MDKIFASRIRGLSYAIREMMPIARELERKGEKILYLNIGDPVKYGFQPPKHIAEALFKAVEEGYNYYSSSEGDEELRKAIAEKEREWNRVELEPQDIFVTYGVSEAINIVFSLFLDPGDKVLIPGPSYPLYISYAKIYNAEPVFYRCIEDEGWEPDVDDIREKITRKTKLIVVINPNNPTGALYGEKTLRKIADLAAEYNIPLVSDEIYDGIVLKGQFRSLATIAKDTIILGLNGLSKTFLMTGWRLGYFYLKAPEEQKEKLREAILKIVRARLGVTTPIQRAGIVALRGPLSHLEYMREELRKRAEYLVKRLNEIGIFATQEPRAAFYIFPKIVYREPWRDDREFVYKLLVENKVLLVHGSGFGSGGEWHTRITFLPSLEVLVEAMDRVESFVKKYSWV